MAAADSSAPAFRRGVRIAADVGTVRVGVAVCDADGILPTPLATLKRDRKGNRDIAAIVREAVERSAVEAYVGLPRKLSGDEGESARLAREFAALLAARLAAAGSECEVRLIDERLTTVEAHRSLHAAGLGSREHRRVVDQVAAVGILQHALDLIRGRGAAGTAVAAPSRRSGEIRGDDSDMRG